MITQRVTLFYLTFIYYLLPVIVAAQTCTGNDGNSYPIGHPACTSARANAGGSSGSGLSFALESRLVPEINSIESLLTVILNVLLVIAVPIIVFFIIVAGFNYVTAQGNPEKIKVATRSLTYAVIGGILILGAVALSEIITTMVDSFRTE